MKCNMGKTDRMLRIGVGVIILAFHYIRYAMTGHYNPWYNLAWLPVITGLVKWCPVYVPFKISTSKED